MGNRGASFDRRAVLMFDRHAVLMFEKDGLPPFFQAYAVSYRNLNRIPASCAVETRMLPRDIVRIRLNHHKAFIFQPRFPIPLPQSKTPAPPLTCGETATESITSKKK